MINTLKTLEKICRELAKETKGKKRKELLLSAKTFKLKIKEIQANKEMLNLEKT